MKLRFRAVVAAAGLSALALTACGSNSLSASPSSSAPSPSAPMSSASTNAGLASKLPAKIKSAGVIVIGTDATYAPNEFLAADGKTVEGMDVDLFNAVAAEFGVKTRWQPADFTTIIAGVEGQKYDMGISSFTINADRKKQVNMVSYFNAGTQWAAATGNPKGIDPNHACGKTVAVQTGTVQQTDDLPKRQAACGANKIKILPFRGQDQATAAVVTGRADAMLADSPVAAYAVKQTHGKLETIGGVYDAAPYGYVVPKSETDFATAIADALKQLRASGGYTAALTKWGVQAGAISNFQVNP